MITPMNGYLIIRDLPQPQAIGLVKSADTLAERTGIGEIVQIDHDVMEALRIGDVVLYNDLASNDIPKRRGLIEEQLYAVHVSKVFAVIAPSDGVPAAATQY